MHRTEERCREDSDAFPGAAVPKDHKLGSLKWQTCIMLLQSGGQKPEIKASAGLAPSETPREHVPRPVPQFLVLPGPGHPLACGRTTQSLPPSSRAHLLCLCTLFCLL